jgi:uncharacterized protein YkwD
MAQRGTWSAPTLVLALLVPALLALAVQQAATRPSGSAALVAPPAGSPDHAPPPAATPSTAPHPAATTSTAPLPTITTTTAAPTWTLPTTTAAPIPTTTAAPIPTTTAAPPTTLPPPTTAPPSTIAAAPVVASIPQPVAGVVQATNERRASAGVPALVWCPTLARSAQAYAEVLAATGALSHVGPDGSTVGQRNTAAGYRGWSVTGENLASGFTTGSAAVAGWMESPSHRDNLLRPDHQHIGVGRAARQLADGTVRWYWVQELGRGGTCSVG